MAINTLALFAPPAEAESIHDIHVLREVGKYGKSEGKPVVRIWRGKQSKPYANYRFVSEAARETFIAQEIAYAKDRLDRKAAQKASKAAFVHTVKVGDIFSNSWGYDQTNVDFYQVVRVTGKSVVIREIGGRQLPSEGHCPDSAYVVPVKDAFTKDSEEILKVVHAGNIISFKHGNGSLHTEGQKHYSSWGH